MRLVIFRTGLNGALQQCQLKQSVREAIGWICGLAGTALLFRLLKLPRTCIQLSKSVMQHRIHGASGRNSSFANLNGFWQQATVHIV